MKEEKTAILDLEKKILDKQKEIDSILQENARIKKTLDDIIADMPGHVYWKNKDGVYLGCNDKQAKSLGLHLGKELIGKTDFDLKWGDNIAEKFRKNDLYVMNSGQPYRVEELATIDGIEKVMLSQKTPLKDNQGEIIGVIGISLDITELKNTQNQLLEANKKLEAANKLKIEHEKQKALLEKEEEFRKIANQVSHDIRSPLSSLLMILKDCTQIPEPQRIALREAATGARDIANHLLNQYRKQGTHNVGAEGDHFLLVSTALLELITAKKYQYEDLAVQFDCHFEDNTHFAFIKADFSDFRRMISNLINNSVDALEDGEGMVHLHLSADNNQVKITIQDTGKGMSPELIAKIMNKTSVTEGKKEGHGIGLTQVWETLDKSHGSMHIDSTIGKGSHLSLTFPRISAPRWLAEEIILKPEDTVIILDDDASIHTAWQTRFEAILDNKSNITRKHFREGKEALEFIHSLSPTEKAKLFLLSDYELLREEFNGLHIIEKSGISRSILVTSHYADPIVQEQASKTGTKILPKELAPEVHIQIVDAEKPDEKNEAPSEVEVVIVEDNESLLNSLVKYVFRDKRVDPYLKPDDLLKNIHRYSKDTKIYLDQNYDNSWLKGLDVAKELHEQGYTRLYLFSGDTFEKGEIPPYLTVIDKLDNDALERSIND